MKILGIDSSAKTASVSILEDGKVLTLQYSNTGFTHSVTLMPMVAGALKITGLSADDIDAYAVSVGPGSFTGVRIGVAAVKGMAQPKNKPCIAVSTLEAIAYPLSAFDCVAVSVMDARREQVYEARFQCTNGGNLIRITNDEALPIESLYDSLKDIKDQIYFIGDGQKLVYNALKDRLKNVRTAPEQISYQKADSVALLAFEKFKRGEAVTPFDLNPVYLRDSQAEQSLKIKNKNNKSNGG